jgi:putative transcriptional regulator
MTPEELKAIRHRLGKNQRAMSAALGMSLSGYRKWEQGSRNISGPALILLNTLTNDMKQP